MELSKIRLTDLYETKARGETCSEIEGMKERTALFYESSVFETMRQQSETCRLGMPSQELLSHQFKVFPSASQELINALESSGIRRLNNEMAEFEPFNIHEFREMQALNGAISRSIEDAKLTLRHLTPKVDPLMFVTPVSTRLLDATNRVNESIAEGAESVNESIKNESESLGTHVKVLIEVNKKMHAVAAANAEKLIAEQKSNRRYKIWMFILSFIMAIGVIPEVIPIISLVKHFIGWIRHIL